ncbi:MAG: hypothetical protein LBE13_10740 [Bacteroidales bacterium]|jgi:hypothetical protein|nr:hypothetical protein [Bacteroidales bacterium]
MILILVDLYEEFNNFCATVQEDKLLKGVAVEELQLAGASICNDGCYSIDCQVVS